MIVFSCPFCHKAMQVPPTMAGHPVSCPACHNVVSVPHAAPAAPEPLSLDDPEEGVTAEADGAAERRTRARRAAEEATRKRNAHIYLWGGLLLTVIATVCAIGLAPKIAKDSRGSRRVTTDELLAMKDGDEAQWVLYSPDKPPVETGFVTEKQVRRGSNKTKITARCVLILVKDKWMVAELAAGSNGNPLEGSVGKWDTIDGKEMMEKIKAKHPDKKDKLLPVQLSTGETSESQFFGLTFAIGAVLLLGAGCAFYGYVSLPRKPKNRGRS